MMTARKGPATAALGMECYRRESTCPVGASRPSSRYRLRERRTDPASHRLSGPIRPAPVPAPRMRRHHAGSASPAAANHPDDTYRRRERRRDRASRSWTGPAAARALGPESRRASQGSPCRVETSPPGDTCPHPGQQTGRASHSRFALGPCRSSEQQTRAGRRISEPSSANTSSVMCINAPRRSNRPAMIGGHRIARVVDLLLQDQIGKTALFTGQSLVRNTRESPRAVLRTCRRGPAFTRHIRRVGTC